MNKKTFIEKIDSIVNTSLSKLFENKKDYNQILDARDKDIFSSKWSEEFDAVVEKGEVQMDNKKLIDEVRKKIYFDVYNKTKSSDLSSYISDDFALIMDAFCVDHKSKWLNGLLYEYLNGRIPQDEIIEKDGNLESILTNSIE